MSENTNSNIFPVLRYKDASSAIDWLQQSFGFEEKAVYRGRTGHRTAIMPRNPCLDLEVRRRS